MLRLGAALHSGLRYCGVTLKFHQRKQKRWEAPHAKRAVLPTRVVPSSCYLHTHQFVSIIVRSPPYFHTPSPPAITSAFRHRLGAVFQCLDSDQNADRCSDRTGATWGGGVYYTIRNLLIVPAGTVGGLLWTHAPKLPLQVAGVGGLLGLAVFWLSAVQSRKRDLQGSEQDGFVEKD